MRKQHLLTLTAVGAATLLATAVAPASATGPTAPRATTAATPANPSDFNGDGYPDLAIGATTATVDGFTRAGAVSVVYGSPTGLRYDKASFISQASPGVPGEPAKNGRWQEIRGSGDFDADGYDDLVMGSGGGHTWILWGSPEGITGTTTNLPDLEAGWRDRVVGAAAIGDVNGDGHADILSLSSYVNIGYDLAVEYGPFTREGEAASTVIRGVEVRDGHASDTLKVGDMTGDGIDDVLFTGRASKLDFSTKTSILKGTKAGLVNAGPLTAPTGLGDFGDINKDGYQDYVGSNPGTEKVTVVYGGPKGASTTLASRTFTQNTPGVPGTSETGDRFGSAIEVADTDQDGYADILIGARDETGTDPEATLRSGAVTILRGSATGVTTTGAQVITQNTAGVPSASEKEDHFGATLRVLDTDKDGRPELYVGGYGEDAYTGRVWKLNTGTTGVTGTGATSFNLSSLGGPAGGASFGIHLVG
ncbi:FG-GAP-like repeat-containing protein [Streptomyces sp. NPDC056773]|uniref:FG-GAP-like repeat-containing protein n=1 Tax=unclassified Streptomyces TaxID=2593676 RepID=UPI0036763D03